MLFHEPEWRPIAAAVERDPIRLISAVSVFEASIVALARIGKDGVDDLDLLLNRIAVEILAFGPTDLPVVRSAFDRYGKGRHPAGLNFGDCFSYALSRVTGQPLLFKGEDFSQTDVDSVGWRDPEATSR